MKVLMFKRFERFWHWLQAMFIILLLLSGFEVRGTYSLLGFSAAVDVHTWIAWALVTLWVFAIFWHVTTGEWKQYIPTLKNVGAMIRYYLLGIFSNAPHPFRPSVTRKHNPLQRLAYLFLWLVVSPMIWVSGWAYMFYPQWSLLGLDQALAVGVVVFFHVLGAFMMLVFLIVHIYLITTGPTVFTHLKAMISGYEEIEYEAEDDPSQVTGKATQEAS